MKHQIERLARLQTEARRLARSGAYHDFAEVRRELMAGGYEDAWKIFREFLDAIRNQPVMRFGAPR